MVQNRSHRIGMYLSAMGFDIVLSDSSNKNGDTVVK